MVTQNRRGFAAFELFLSVSTTIALIAMLLPSVLRAQVAASDAPRKKHGQAFHHVQRFGNQPTALR